MLQNPALPVVLSALLFSALAVCTASSAAPFRQGRSEHHNISVIPHLSMNIFGHDTFCSNVQDVNRTGESEFQVADCRTLMAGLSGPLTYYNTWFTVNDQDCDQSGDPWWIPVVGRLSCNFAVYMPDCPDGGVVLSTLDITRAIAHSILDHGESNASIATGRMRCGFEPSPQNVAFRISDRDDRPKDQAEWMAQYGFSSSSSASSPWSTTMLSTSTATITSA